MPSTFAVSSDIRSYNTNQATPTRPGRNNVRLSDGQTVAIAVRDSTGVSTDSIYIYTVKNGELATNTGLTFGVNTASSGKGNPPRLAMTCDSLDNLHIVYTFTTVAGSIGVGYRKLTRSGSTWTIGSPVTVNAATSGYADIRCDIDIANTGAASIPVICLTKPQTTAGVGSIGYYTVNAGTASLVFGSAPATASIYFNQGSPRVIPCGVAAVHTTQPLISGIQGIAFWAWNFITKDSLELLYVVTPFDGSTGQVIYSYGSPLSSFPESVDMFTTNSTSGAEECTFMARVQNSSFVQLVRVLAGPVSVVPVFNITVNHGMRALGVNTMATMVDRNTLAISGLSSQNVPLVRLVTFSGVTATLDPAFSWAPTFGGVVKTTSYIYGGSNRNIDTGNKMPDVMIHYITSAHPKGTLVFLPLFTLPSVTYQSPDAYTGGPIATLPSPQNIPHPVNSDVPTMNVVPAGSINFQSQVKATFQWSQDSAFATGIISSSSDWVAPGTTITKQLEAINKLTAQGLWYYRTFLTDRFGQTTDYHGWFSKSGSTYSYNPLNVTHPPTATPISPANDAYIGATTGVVTFLFGFSDTSSVDTQSGFQFQIATAASNGDNIVEDSGVVTSTDGIYSSSLWSGGAYLETPMLWRVAVIDSDGVAGLYCAWQRITIATPPAPVITSPTPGSIVTTSLATISWTTGIIAPKTESKYRVVLQQAGVTVYDSSTLSPAPDQPEVTSLTLPFGSVHNGLNYVATLFITDNFGAVGVTITNFTVSLSLPHAPNEIDIYDYMFPRLGYVWIGWDNSQVDTDFISWNLYRRSTKDSDWQLLATFTEDQPFYGFADRTADTNITYTYCVTQIVNRDGLGDFIESARTTTKNVRLVNQYYWLIDPEDQLGSFQLFNATSDSYTDVIERTTLTVVGAGRHVDEGEALGLDGSLVCQLRDHPIGLVPTTNVLRDPSFQNNLPFSTEWEYSATNTVSYSPGIFKESAPLPYSSLLRIQAIPGTTVKLKQEAIGPPVYKTFDVFNVSIWNVDLRGTLQRVKVQVDYYDDAHALIQSDTQTLIPIQNPQVPAQNWVQWAIPFFIPEPNVASIDITYIFDDPDTLGLDFIPMGAQVTYGQQLMLTFDGNTPGADWDGVADISTSTTNGNYTARQQKEDIIEMSKLGRPIYLRTPFGDIYKVTLGDLQFSRLAGVGSESEFGDLTIPYQEVAL